MANTKKTKNSSSSNKKTTTKKVNSKKKTTNKIVSNKKETVNYKLIVLILVIVLIVIGLSLVFNANKSVTCVKNGIINNGVKQTNEIVLNGKDIINSVDVKKTIVIDTKYDSNYLDIIEDSIKKAYDDKNIKCSTKKESNSLIVNLSYTKKEKYILDDLDIIISDAGVSVNVINDDNYDSYASIDLTNNNKKDDLIKEFQTKKYICK